MSTSATPVDLADYRWLVSSQAEPLLARAAAIEEPLARAKALRADLSATRARLILEQTELRQQARSKFALADQMFFTSVGLQQASDQWIAAYKARRFPAGHDAVDLCCGIGGDLMALAARGRVVGVDRDPVCALFAASNAERAAGARAAAVPIQVEVADVADWPLAADGFWHLDPDRRPTGRRTTNVAWHDPSPEVVERLLQQSASGAIKLAPAAEPPLGWSERAEWEWISRQRECRQLVAWFGELAQSAGLRRATQIDASGEPHSLVGPAHVPIPLAAQPGQYVFEPDPAVLAADLAGSLAERHQLQAWIPRGGYLTADHLPTEALLTAFAVEEVIPYREKRLRAALRERGIGRVEVKLRGVDIDPAAVQRSLRGEGDQRATLLLARREKSIVAVLARRVAE